jgi:hypothetical protein
MSKPSLQSTELIAVAKRLGVTPDAVRDVLRALRAGATTLVAESKKLGVSSERLRAALRELLGVENYATLMQVAGDSKSPGTKAFSWKRQKRLERMLAGEDPDGGFHQVQEASPQTTQEMWDTIAGEGGPRSPRPEMRTDNPVGRQQSDTGAGPFTRGDDTRGPFDRR